MTTLATPRTSSHFAQYLALFTALEWGKTPDNPFPAGEVSRVVKGVTIHPMTLPGKDR